MWRYTGLYEMLSVMLSCIAIGAVSYLSLVALPTRASRGIILIFTLLHILGAGILRLSPRIYIMIKNQQKRGHQYKRTLIVGAGDAGVMVIKELLNHPEMGIIPVAAVDDDKNKINKIINGVKILGDRHGIAKIVKEKDIDHIIVALPSAENADKSEILNICKDTGCKVKTLPGVYQIINGKVDISQIRYVQIEDLLGRDPIELNIEGIEQYIRNNVVMVTGGGGSIGSELSRQIAEYKPKKLILLDIYENGVYDLQQELLRVNKGLDLVVIIASVRDRARLEQIFKTYSPDMVFHAAAHKHVPLMESNPTEAIKNNVFGTLNVAELSDRYNVKKFVLISTDKAVNPTNVMGATKRIAEMIVQAMARYSRTEFVAVRFGNVLGSNGSVIPLFKKQIAEGGPITVTHPDIIRYFMTIPEAVQLVLQAGSMAKGGEIFVLDMGKPVRIVDLARDLIRLSGFVPDVDIKIEFSGLRPGEKLYEELLMAEEGLQSTNHEKIFVTQPLFVDYKKLHEEILELQRVILNNDDLRNVLREMVPTYTVPSVK